MRNNEKSSSGVDAEGLIILAGTVSVMAIVGMIWAAVRGTERMNAEEIANRIARNTDSARGCLAQTFFAGDSYCGKLSQEERDKIEFCMRRAGIDDPDAIDKVIDGNCSKNGQE